MVDEDERVLGTRDHAGEAGLLTGERILERLGHR